VPGEVLIVGWDAPWSITPYSERGGVRVWALLEPKLFFAMLVLVLLALSPSPDSELLPENHPAQSGNHPQSASYAALPLGLALVAPLFSLVLNGAIAAEESPSAAMSVAVRSLVMRNLLACLP
jgi:hypothetical protein